MDNDDDIDFVELLDDSENQIVDTSIHAEYFSIPSSPSSKQVIICLDTPTPAQKLTKKRENKSTLLKNTMNAVEIDTTIELSTKLKRKKSMSIVEDNHKSGSIQIPNIPLRTTSQSSDIIIQDALKSQLSDDFIVQEEINSIPQCNQLEEEIPTTKTTNKCKRSRKDEVIIPNNDKNKRMKTSLPISNEETISLNPTTSTTTMTNNNNNNNINDTLPPTLTSTTLSNDSFDKYCCKTCGRSYTFQYNEGYSARQTWPLPPIGCDGQWYVAVPTHVSIPTHTQTIYLRDEPLIQNPLSTLLPTTTSSISSSIIPGWEILLLLDNREILDKQERDYISGGLCSRGIQVQVRTLPLGDVMWIARPKAAVEYATAQAEKALASAKTAAARKRAEDLRKVQDEFPLAFIIERKGVKDLAHSLVDGRYSEQKLRLASMGMRVIYLIEGDITHSLRERNGRGIGPSHIYGAIANTIVSNGFQVVNTVSTDATISWLVNMHYAVIASFLRGITRYRDLPTCISTNPFSENETRINQNDKNQGEKNIHSPSPVALSPRNSTIDILEKEILGLASIAEDTTKTLPNELHTREHSTIITTTTKTKNNNNILQSPSAEIMKLGHSHTQYAAMNANEIVWPIGRICTNTKPISSSLSTSSLSLPLPTTTTTTMTMTSSTTTTDTMIHPIQEPTNIITFPTCTNLQCQLWGRNGLPHCTLRFSEWCIKASKPKTFTAMSIFGRMLRQIPGCSSERIEPLLQKYPLPTLFMDAFLPTSSGTQSQTFKLQNYDPSILFHGGKKKNVSNLSVQLHNIMSEVKNTEDMHQQYLIDHLAAMVVPNKHRLLGMATAKTIVEHFLSLPSNKTTMENVMESNNIHAVTTTRSDDFDYPTVESDRYQESLSITSNNIPSTSVTHTDTNSTMFLQNLEDTAFGDFAAVSSSTTSSMHNKNKSRGGRFVPEWIRKKYRQGRDKT